MPLEYLFSFAFRIKFVIPYRTQQPGISCPEALLYGSAVDNGMDRKQCVLTQWGSGACENGTGLKYFSSSCRTDARSS